LIERQLPNYGADLFSALKLFLYGYLQRIRSSRRLENECRRNIELMWLLGRLVPEHKTVARCSRPFASRTGIGSDVIKPIAAPVVGGMITSTIHVLILVRVFFVMMKQRALRKGTLQANTELNETNTVELARQ